MGATAGGSGVAAELRSQLFALDGRKVGEPARRTLAMEEARSGCEPATAGVVRRNQSQELGVVGAKLLGGGSRNCRETQISLRRELIKFCVRVETNACVVAEVDDYGAKFAEAMSGCCG